MEYGNYQYGAQLFGLSESNSTDDGTQTDIAKVLKSYVPQFISENSLYSATYDCEGAELDTIYKNINDILSQCFVQTATWGLDLWEKQLGLSTDIGKSYIRRREIVMAKLLGSGTTTKAMIINVAAAFSGGEVDVIEHPSEYRFEVQFIGIKGIPPNMPGLMETIENIKPAHLAYSFKYNYTWWESIKALTWSQTAAKTWNQLKIYEGE